VRSNPVPLCIAALLVSFAAGPRDAQAQARPLTQEELLRQIESLSPAASDPGRSSSNRTAKPNTVGGAGASLFPEKKEPKAKPEKKAKGPTEIVALEATFDQKAHLAIFIGEVVVKDPEFTVLADKLTAYLKHGEKLADGAVSKSTAPSPESIAGADKEKRPKGSSGLERAIAEADPGKIVTVTQEKEEIDGSISRSVGHGKKVHYDSISGDITLYGKPDVQQGINTCVATDEGTIMILNRDGKMRVTGPHKTVIAEKLEK